MIKLDELIEEKALLEKDFKTTNESIAKLTNDLAQMKANLNALNGAIQQTNKFISMCQKEAEEKENPDDSYPDFIADLKNSIIEYGSIVKELKSDESLIFKISFPKCEDCQKMPTQMEITAKKSTLDAYRKEQISLEDAINQLVVK